MDKHRLLRIFFAVISVTKVTASKGYMGDDVYINHILTTAQTIIRNSTWGNAWRENAQYSTRDQDLGLQYTCQLSPSVTTPTSVHALRPGDIKFVAALGGSVTSGLGLGATEAFYLLYENRGKAWSGGGDGQLNKLHKNYEETGIVTLPNILKQFNPSLLGYSTGTGEVTSPTSRLNRAWSGAMAKDLESQADDLHREMLRTESMNLGHDWKHLTIFIGIHDVCHACNDPDSFSVVQFIEYVERALDKLQANIPRLLVSLVPVYNTAGLGDLADNIICEKSLRLLCPCALKRGDQEYSRTMQMQYYQAMRTLVDSHKYDKFQDFTVVLQPHLLNLGFPVEASDSLQPIDKTFMAPDCFHPNHRGHRMLAYMLWNTMLTPVGHKSTRYPHEEVLKLYCPTTGHPFIFTNNNSVGVEWQSGGFIEEEDPSDLRDIITISSVAAIACGMILAIIVGLFVFCCCKKYKDPKLDLGYTKVGGLELPMESDDIKGSRLGPDGTSRRSSHESNASSAPSLSHGRRPSTDFFINMPHGKRRGSLEPSAALNIPTAQNSRLSARRGSEDLRRDVLNNKFQHKRNLSDGCLPLVAQNGNDQVSSVPVLDQPPKESDVTSKPDVQKSPKPPIKPRSSAKKKVPRPMPSPNRTGHSPQETVITPQATKSHNPPEKSSLPVQKETPEPRPTTHQTNRADNSARPKADAETSPRRTRRRNSMDKMNEIAV